MAALVQAGACGARASTTWGVAVPQQSDGRAHSCYQVVSKRSKRGAIRAEADASATTAPSSASAAINPSIKKDSDKVVDTVLVGELAKPLTAYCRCWRSGTFPLCDGSHVKHNKATGDNVGPLLLKK